jgi:hypothetical protein
MCSSFGPLCMSGNGSIDSLSWQFKTGVFGWSSLEFSERKLNVDDSLKFGFIDFLIEYIAKWGINLLSPAV